MQIMPLNFLLYAVSGMWRPLEWTFIGSTLLYSIYTILTVYLMSFLLVTQFLDIVLVVDNVEDFTSNSLIFIAAISAFFKVITALTRRGHIISLIEILQQPPCRVCDQEEMDIKEKFDHSIRSLSLSYLFLVMTSIVGGLIGLILQTLQGQLPVRAWVPYNYTSHPLLFWLTSAQLLIAVGPIGGFINISTESLIYGLCLQTCAQFEILAYRIQRMARLSEEVKSCKSKSNDISSDKASRLSEHICHHLCIIRYAELVNEIYSQVFFIQFFVSILVLCSSLYYLSSHMTFKDIATMSAYSFSMFVQILVYCWAGNEVILKSTSLSDAIYQMDWILMTINEQKDLLMIMKRSTRPIKFTSSFLVTLSLSSYGNLLKVSYSAFNLLQQS